VSEGGFEGGREDDAGSIGADLDPSPVAVRDAPPFVPDEVWSILGFPVSAALRECDATGALLGISIAISTIDDLRFGSEVTATCGARSACGFGGGDGGWEAGWSGGAGGRT
jgi:hypothetical protein